MDNQIYYITDLYLIRLTNSPNVEFVIKDQEKFDFYDSMYSDTIITDKDEMDSFYECFIQARMNLDEEFADIFNNLISACSLFSHSIMFEGKQIFTSTQNEPFEEIFNPESKKRLRNVRKYVSSGLETKINENPDIFDILQ